MALATGAQGQTTANWIGPAAGGEWNTGANWDTGFPPLDATTNAYIGSGSNVNYSLPMAASSFGTLTLDGVLNVNASGFNSSGISMIHPGGGSALFINNSGVVNLSGDLAISSNAAVSIATGGAFTTTATLRVGSGSTAGSGGFMTNYGGNITATTTTINNNNASASSALVISGGTNNLGDVTINRAGPSKQPALGTEGLIVSNGIVNVTSLTVGGSSANSFLSMYMAGGIVTNSGAMTVHLSSTSGRPARFLQTGGLAVTMEPNVVTMNPQGTSAGVTTVYAILGGTNYAGGFQFGDVAGANLGTANFTNAAAIYVGSEGMNSNGAVNLNAMLNNGGLFGASADWTGNAGMVLNGGTFTFQAAAEDGTAHNILLNGILSGPGGLVKTGAGTLTMDASNTYAGITYVKEGTLALGSNDVSGSVGSLASESVIVGSGTIFDVSQAGYSVQPLQILGGFGSVSGAVTVAPNGVINPGSNNITGALSFNNDVIETNGAVNHFDIPGDVINITGSLTASGVNTMDVSGSVPPGTAYALVHYGTFNGDVSNFAVTGATGVLSNSVTDKTIYLIVSSSLRANTNLTWVGNSTNNVWDTHNSTNWVDSGSSTPDFFLSGDNARFDDSAANNTNVTIPDFVSPASVVVDSTLNYVFTGDGSISGQTATLTKTNSGTLTILTTNTYAGATTLGGGVLEILSITNSSIPSPIGAATSDPGSLVFNGGTLRYSGDIASTDRGATFNTNAIIDVTNSATTLTLNGTMTGVGGLTKLGAGELSLAGLNGYLGATTLSNGVLTVNAVSAISPNTINYAGGTLNLASASSQQFYGNLNNVVTTGTIVQNGANANSILSGGWTGDGTINIDIQDSGGTLSLNHDITSNFGGTMRLTDASTGTLRFNSGGNATSAQQCTGSPTVTFDLGNGSASLINRNGGGTSFGNYDLGALMGGPGTFLKGSANNGSLSTYFIGAKNLDTAFAGTIADGNSGPTAIAKVGAGTLTLTGNNTYTGSTIVSNGVLALGDGTTDGFISSSTNIDIEAGAVLDVSKLSGGTLFLGSQTIQGNGTLNGSLSDNSGIVAPGGGIYGGIGTLTVTNTTALFNETWMKLDRTAAQNSDRLVSPSISLNGSTLIVTNIGPSLKPGDTFTLFSGTLSGAFGNVILPNYYTWDTNQLALNGTIRVVSFNPPGLGMDFSQFSSGVITFNATNGLQGGAVSVLSTTNLSLPVSQWTNVVSGFFDGFGNFTSPVTVDPTVPTQFFILSVQ
ncbi:MAG TPA: autotransporter-associated beta strand repeat-containing protein [Candidatus Angelobacter sp.]|nr:autotransporter-associated beta strand repeat-containing protein [Candidatus Angelobacter sp.]